MRSHLKRLELSEAIPARASLPRHAGEISEKVLRPICFFAPCARRRAHSRRAPSHARRPARSRSAHQASRGSRGDETRIAPALGRTSSSSAVTENPAPAPLQAGASVFGASPPADARAPNPRVRARRRRGRDLASTRVPSHRVARLVGPRATSTRESHDQSRGRDAAEEQQIPRSDPVPPHEKVARADIRGGKDDESRVRSRANTAASSTASAKPSPPPRRPDPTRASDPNELIGRSPLVAVPGVVRPNAL